MKLFGGIEKFETSTDGTLIVTGTASSACQDSEGEIITAEAMREALPEYMRFANVREMHTNKAAGVTLSAEVTDSGETRILAKVVDAEAVKKVVEGVYKGFSIGGKALAKALNKITRLRLTEISLVDRPANPECVFDCWKADTDSLHNNNQEQNMSISFAKALGLPEAATEEQITTELAKRLTPPDVKAAVEDAVAKAVKGLAPSAEWSEKLKSLETTISELNKRNKDSDETLAKAQRESIVAEAARDGKVIPLSNDLIEKTPVEILKAMIAGLPKTVPTSVRSIKPLDDKGREEVLKNIQASRRHGVDELNAMFAKIGVTN